MAYNKFPKLPTWAESVVGQPLNLERPTDPEISSGFVRTPTPPKRKWFNWLLNTLASGVQYLTRKGISDWDILETYVSGDKVVSPVDGKVYQAKESSTGNEPSVSPLKWERWGFTNAENDSRYAALYGNPSIRFAVEDAVQLDEAVTLAQLTSTTNDTRDDLTPLLVDGLNTINSTLVGYHYHPATGYTEIWGYMDSGGNTSDLYPITLDIVYHVSLTPIFNSTVSNAEAAVVQLKAFPTTTGISIVSSVEAEVDDVFHADAGVKIMWKVTGKRISAP